MSAVSAAGHDVAAGWTVVNELTGSIDGFRLEALFESVAVFGTHGAQQRLAKMWRWRLHCLVTARGGNCTTTVEIIVG